MHEEFHASLLRATLGHFKVDKETVDLLCHYAVVPDKKATEKIANYETPEPEDDWDRLRNGLSWIGNAFLQLGTWAYLHGSGAPQRFLDHLESARNNLGEGTSHGEANHEVGIKNLGYCLHYVTDTGTPFHSKPLSETLLEIVEPYRNREGELTDAENARIIEETVWAFSMRLVHHSHFEKKLLLDWEHPETKSAYVASMERGIKEANDSSLMVGPSGVGEALKGEIEELRRFSASQYELLDKLYRRIQAATRGSERKIPAPFEAELTKIGLACTHRISRLTARTLSLFFEPL